MAAAQTFWPEIGQSVFVLPNVWFVKKVNADERLKFQGVWGIQSQTFNAVWKSCSSGPGQRHLALP